MADAASPIDPQALKGFDDLLAPFFDADKTKLPLLVHYTSIAVMRHILESSEIWFSNPLFMNDLQELRFGLIEGGNAVGKYTEKAGGTPARAAILQHSFLHYYNKFTNEKAIDAYVFCLSEHGRDDNDGLLSMWRGYGQHGGGVALVFDPANVVDMPNSPFSVCRVVYVSNSERQNILEKTLDRWATITAGLALKDEHLYSSAYRAFHITKYLTLICKHT
jgi:hypothetical protein